MHSPFDAFFDMLRMNFMVARFLQELLVRRVPQTLFVYLGVCWALIEVSAFIEGRFALGGGWPTG